MSQLEILSPHCPIDLSGQSPFSDPFSAFPRSWSWSPKSVIHESSSKSPSARIVSDSSAVDGRVHDDDIIFPSLPPLRNGHPDVQLRNGIMRASRLAVANEPDAESAFFVADLGQVYMQHERWKKCLPDIEPHYGGWSGIDCPHT